VYGRSRVLTDQVYARIDPSLLEGDKVVRDNGILPLQALLKHRPFYEGFLVPPLQAQVPHKRLLVVRRLLVNRPLRPPGSEGSFGAEDRVLLQLQRGLVKAQLPALQRLPRGRVPALHVY
jgi:hypothetical protein